MSLMRGTASHRVPRSTSSANGTATNFYHDRIHELDAVKVLPGEYYVTGEDMVLVTVLGSCVTACVRDPLYGIGGMNHFMLPDAGQDAGEAALTSARYGGYAMEMLINTLLKQGARREALEAKVFGGGAVMSSLSQSQVGERNVQFVLDYMKLENIPVLSSDLGNVYPRKVYFFPKSGRVLQRKLLTIPNETIFEREREYRSSISKAPASGDVVLFN